MDITALQRQAVGATGRIVAAIKVDQMEDPTPCPDWDVRTVVNHVIAMNRRWADLVEGKPVDPPDVVPDLVGDDPVAAYEAAAAAVLDAWSAPGVADREFDRMGGTPGRVLAGIHAVDLLVHGWDLAVATGQDAHLDPDLATAALDFVSATLPDGARGRSFGPPVEVPAGASPGDRLVAFLGRTP